MGSKKNYGISEYNFNFSTVQSEQKTNKQTKIRETNYMNIYKNSEQKERVRGGKKNITWKENKENTSQTHLHIFHEN